jgi:hypothetical protein
VFRDRLSLMPYKDIVLEELESLLSWNPPLLFQIYPEGKKPSTSTCQPSFFDQHLSTQLVLKRVTRLPSLVQDVAMTVAGAIAAASGNRVELLSLRDFYTTDQRKRAEMQAGTFMANELAVAEFYRVTSGTFFPPVASTLVLHPKASSGWSSVIAWNLASTTSGYAIVDGFLQFRPEVKFVGKSVEAMDDETRRRYDQAVKGMSDATRQHYDELVEAMDDETRRGFDAVQKHLQCLATWGMKSLDAGGSDVISAIPKLSTMPAFDWAFCKLRCTHSGKKLEKVKNVKIGPDAQRPPWNINVRHPF